MSAPKLPDGYSYLDDGSICWGRRLTREEITQVHEYLRHKGLMGEVMHDGNEQRRDEEDNIDGDSGDE